MANRTFTPFQLWLETQLAGGRTLTNVASALGMSVQQLSRMRSGRASFPKPRLQEGMRLTGLSLKQLLQPAEPKPRPTQITPDSGPPTEPSSPPEMLFQVTPERVQVALQNGLKFGPERVAFCDTRPSGDLDKAWKRWCAQRGKANGSPAHEQGPPPAPARGLYDHLKRDAKRPDFRPDPDLVSAADTASGHFSLRVAKPE